MAAKCPMLTSRYGAEARRSRRHRAKVEAFSSGDRLSSFRANSGSAAHFVLRRGPRHQPSRLCRDRAEELRPHHRHSSDRRISFAPETTVTRGNKHDRTDQIFRKINASNSCPAAHNGLVGGSNWLCRG